MHIAILVEVLQFPHVRKVADDSGAAKNAIAIRDRESSDVREAAHGVRPKVNHRSSALAVKVIIICSWTGQSSGGYPAPTKHSFEQ